MPLRIPRSTLLSSCFNPRPAVRPGDAQDQQPASVVNPVSIRARP